MTSPALAVPLHVGRYVSTYQDSFLSLILASVNYHIGKAKNEQGSMILIYHPYEFQGEVYGISVATAFDEMLIQNKSVDVENFADVYKIIRVPGLVTSKSITIKVLDSYHNLTIPLEDEFIFLDIGTGL